MVKRQLVCNVFHNVASDDFYIGTASAIYCATGFPLPLNRSQMGALLGISEDTMIEKVVYNDFDCAYKSDLEGFNLDDNVKNEVEVKKMAVGIYYMGETLIPLATEDKKMAGLGCASTEILSTGRTSLTRKIPALHGKKGKSKMKKLEPAEIRRLAAIALWWLCVGIVLSNLLSVLLQNLTEWIMSLV